MDTWKELKKFFCKERDLFSQISLVPPHYRQHRALMMRQEDREMIQFANERNQIPLRFSLSLPLWRRVS
jgi:hypothetical protein